MTQTLFKQVGHKTYRFLDAITAVNAFKSHISVLEASHYEKPEHK